MRKAIFNSRLVFGLAVTLVAGYAVYISLHWPYKTALFPRMIAVPLLLLGLLETLLCLFAAEKEKGGAAVDLELSADVDPIIARNRTRSLVLWILGFFVLIPLVGFGLAVPLFMFLYLKLAGKEGWLLSILLAAFSWLFMEGLFNRLLHLPFPPGWIFSLWS